MSVDIQCICWYLCWYMRYLKSQIPTNGYLRYQQNCMEIPSCRLKIPPGRSKTSLSRTLNLRINPTKEHDLTEDIVRMIKAQKKLSRKKKGSQNRKKSKLKLAKKHLKIKNKRNDFLHKTAKKLSENQTIAVENLQIKNMSKSAKGTIEIPGKNVAQKRGLNRSILQKSWGIFFEILEYKLKRNGGQLIKVDPKYTSQECSDCGHTSSQNRKKSKFICVKCQVTLHADHNAAINISMR